MRDFWRRSVNNAVAAADDIEIGGTRNSLFPSCMAVTMMKYFPSESPGRNFQGKARKSQEIRNEVWTNALLLDTRSSDGLYSREQGLVER